MPGRKPNPDRLDVPTPIVAAVVVLLLVVFVPLIVLRPDLPASLPPLTTRPVSLVAAHRTVETGAPVLALDQAFDAIAEAQDRRDPLAAQLAQHTFASLMVDVAGDDVHRRTARRETALRRFTAALDARRTTDPLVRIAARHGLVGVRAPSWITRDVQLAWFDLRWESLAARETLRGEPAAMDRAFERLEPDERRVLAAWALGIDCAPLLGLLPANTVRDVADAERCAHSREDWIALAAHVDASYPAAEARAAVVALHARDVRALALRSADRGRGAELDGDARQLFGEANLRYREVCAVEPARRLRRYLLGTAQASGAE